MAEAAQECRACVQLFQHHELVCLMRLRNGARAANHRGNSRPLKEARFGAIRDGVNVIAAG